MPGERAAVEALEELGLTEYEAKCFVALTRVAEGTAKEVSKLSDIPRSRVYDTVERLHERGLVDVQQSDPRRYKAVPKEAAFEKLRKDYISSIEAADRALDNVQSSENVEEEGAWSISEHEHVVDRVEALVDDAEESIHYLVADAAVVEERTLERLAAASDRGVTVVVEVGSDEIRDRIDAALPDARVEVVSNLRETVDIAEKWPGQALLVDRRSALASGVSESHLPHVTTETAIWSKGNDHGFAVWFGELLTERLDDAE